jgi:hypothetical protein
MLHDSSSRFPEKIRNANGFSTQVLPVSLRVEAPDTPEVR